MGNSPESFIVTCKLVLRSGLFPLVGDLTSLFPFGFGILVGLGEVGGDETGEVDRGNGEEDEDSMAIKPS
jgi:hypothetical protein